MNCRLGMLGLIASTLMSHFLIHSASADPLSPPALFSRCYAMFTGRPLPLNHSLFIQVKEGQLQAIEACSRLIQSAELDPNSGSISAASSSHNEAVQDSRIILERFYEFHRSWFSSNLADQFVGYTRDFARGTADVYDATEPSLHLTRALLHPEGKYHDIVTKKVTYKALRERSAALDSRYGFTVTQPSRAHFGNSASAAKKLIEFMGLLNSVNAENLIIKEQTNEIGVGHLVGIIEDTLGFQAPNLHIHPLGDGKLAGHREMGLNFEFNLYENLGGGVLGSPVFLMHNFGHDLGTKSNGSTKLPRRWSQTIFNTFLCSQLPALRESDIRKYYVGNSSAQFRNSNSCIRCHASMDQMAMTARNVVTGNSSFTDFDDPNGGKGTLLLTTYKPELTGNHNWASEPVSNFHRMQPKGALMFRSVTGQLVNQPVEGIQQLGEAIAQTPDFYQCAAKRYFEFMTGIQVTLYDRQDPANVELNKTLSPKDLRLRLLIERLAENLQTHQSLKQLLIDILETAEFQDRNFEPGN